MVGRYVSVPFHGRTVKGYVLGETDDVPARMLPVRRVLSAVPVFAEAELPLYRWMAERYVAPLATVIGRAHPPRVAAVEKQARGTASDVPAVRPPDVLRSYQGGVELAEACERGGGPFLLRPLPDHEAGACVEAVAACLRGGRDAVVVVPEAEPLPETARAVAEAFGDAALLYVGGSERVRYRGWLDVLAGRYRVVIGTRPAVFAPLRNLGLVWVNREAHPALHEDRSPYHHVRDVALARGRLRSAVAVLAAHCPSAAAVAAVDRGEARLVRASRAAERAAAPLVETIRPEREEVGTRLGNTLRRADGAFLLVSRRGYGFARVCKRCGSPARCGVCGGGIAVAEDGTRCVVCAADGICAVCGGATFGVDPRGTEHVQAQAERLTTHEVVRVDEGDDAVPPGAGRVVVGTAAAVKDFGPLRVGLVAVLDADGARRRAGIAAAEQALATWMEAAAWAGPKGSGGRVIIQTEEPGDASIQALVRWDPWHFHRREAERRREAGFPPGHSVFRLRGTAELPERLAELQPTNVLSTSLGDETVCLITLRPDAASGLREWVQRNKKLVTRVEAEPQL